MADIIVGIMGPGANPTEPDLSNAYALGKMCAAKNYTVLTGGHNNGVMHAALKGAKEAGGRTLAILAFDDKAKASEYADIVVVTGMGSARNNINILTSDVVVACGLEAGTLSEIALALKASKKIVLMTQNNQALSFLKDFGKDNLFTAQAPEEAFLMIEKILADAR
jgi:uncharacterized protein (TIGR00725 family)